MYKYATDTFSIIIMLERTRKGNTVLHDYVRLIVFHIACFKSLLERVNLVIANISFDPLVLWFAEDSSLPLALSAHLKVFNVLLPGDHLHLPWLHAGCSWLTSLLWQKVSQVSFQLCFRRQLHLLHVGQIGAGVDHRDQRAWLPSLHNGETWPPLPLGRRELPCERLL